MILIAHRGERFRDEDRIPALGRNGIDLYGPAFDPRFVLLYLDCLFHERSSMRSDRETTADRLIGAPCSGGRCTRNRGLTGSI